MTTQPSQPAGEAAGEEPAIVQRARKRLADMGTLPKEQGLVPEVLRFVQCDGVTYGEYQELLAHLDRLSTPPAGSEPGEPSARDWLDCGNCGSRIRTTTTLELPPMPNEDERMALLRRNVDAAERQADALERLCEIRLEKP